MKSYEIFFRNLLKFLNGNVETQGPIMNLEPGPKKQEFELEGSIKCD